jgi:hypothetical protein
LGIYIHLHRRLVCFLNAFTCLCGMILPVLAHKTTKVYPYRLNIPLRRTDNVINARYTVNLQVYRKNQIHRHPYKVLLPLAKLE